MTIPFFSFHYGKYRILCKYLQISVACLQTSQIAASPEWVSEQLAIALVKCVMPSF